MLVSWPAFSASSGITSAFSEAETLRRFGFGRSMVGPSCIITDTSNSGFRGNYIEKQHTNCDNRGAQMPNIDWILHYCAKWWEYITCILIVLFCFIFKATSGMSIHTVLIKNVLTSLYLPEFCLLLLLVIFAFSLSHTSPEHSFGEIVTLHSSFITIGEARSAKYYSSLAGKYCYFLTKQCLTCTSKYKNALCNYNTWNQHCGRPLYRKENTPWRFADTLRATAGFAASNRLCRLVSCVGASRCSLFIAILQTRQIYVEILRCLIAIPICIPLVMLPNPPNLTSRIWYALLWEGASWKSFKKSVAADVNVISLLSILWQHRVLQALLRDGS